MDRPRGVLLGVLEGLDRRVELDVRLEVEAAHQRLEVVEDLRLFGELAGPVGLRREREAVQVRGHVAGRPRIGVVAPGASDAVGLLVDREGLDPGQLELDGHGETAGSGTEDDDPRAGCSGRDRLGQAGPGFATPMGVAVDRLSRSHRCSDRHQRPPRSRRGGSPKERASEVSHDRARLGPVLSPVARPAHRRRRPHPRHVPLGTSGSGRETRNSRRGDGVAES